MLEEQFFIMVATDRHARVDWGFRLFSRQCLEKYPPNLVLAYDPAGIMRGYEWIRYMMATEKADFFTSHDPDAWKTMKHAPDFYE